MNHFQFIYKKLQLQLKEFPLWKNIDNIIFGILYNKQLNTYKICNKIILFNRYNKLLDRCWYSVLQFQRYQLIQPKILIKNNYKIVNCGYLKVF